MLKSLSELKLGDNAKIVSFSALNAALRQKLFAYGLLPGAAVSVVRVAPFGDPVQIRLDGDIMLSISKSECHDVTVQLAV